MGRKRKHDTDLPPGMFKRRERYYYDWRKGVPLGDDYHVAMTRYVALLTADLREKRKSPGDLMRMLVCPTCRRPFDTLEQRYRNQSRKLATEAVKRGELKAQPCEKCGAEYAEKHHDDYTKPLDVRWLCRKCHVEHHRAHKRVEPSPYTAPR